MGFTDLLAVADRSVRQKLGGSVTYTPTVGVAVVVDGIFTAPHTNVDLGNEGGGVSTVSPTCFLTLADLPSDPKTDTAGTLSAGGVTYTWWDVRPDGMGGVLLMLHRAT